MENDTNILVTDENIDELEELYGAIPEELFEAPITHELEDTNEAFIQDEYLENEEVSFNETGE